MSIDFASTTYFSFAEAAKLLPGRPHISTLAQVAHAAAFMALSWPP